MNLADVEAIEEQYKLRDDLLSRGEHKAASVAHVEFHRLVYRHWPEILKILAPTTPYSSAIANSKNEPPMDMNFKWTTPVSGGAMEVLYPYRRV